MRSVRSDPTVRPGGATSLEYTPYNHDFVPFLFLFVYIFVSSYIYHTLFIGRHCTPHTLYTNANFTFAAEGIMWRRGGAFLLGCFRENIASLERILGKYTQRENDIIQGRERERGRVFFFSGCYCMVNSEVQWKIARLWCTLFAPNWNSYFTFGS